MATTPVDDQQHVDPTPAPAAQPAAEPSESAHPAGTSSPARRYVPSLWRQVALLALIAVLIVGASLHHAESRPEPLAAVVNGLPVTMAAYQRQLRFAGHGYSGPHAPAQTPTGRTIQRLLANRAVSQAIAAVVIDHEAALHHLTVGPAQLARELARMTAVAGGPVALRRQMQTAGMTMDDVRWVAAHTLLRDQLGTLLHDHAWLDHLVATAHITYYVADGAVGADRVPTVALGHPAPPFVAQDLKGRAVSLADLAGRPVVLNFWATWCGWCLEELPMLLRFAHAHPGIAVVALDRQEDTTTVRAYIHAHHLQGLTVWLDGGGQAGNDYTVSELPATFFIDRDGILRSYNFGALANMHSLRDQARLAVRRADNTY